MLFKVPVLVLYVQVPQAIFPKHEKSLAYNNIQLLTPPFRPCRPLRPRHQFLPPGGKSAEVPRGPLPHPLGTLGDTVADPGREEVCLPDGVEEVLDSPAVAATGVSLPAAGLGPSSAGVEVQVAQALQEAEVGRDVAQVPTVGVDHVDERGRFCA